MSVKVMNRSSPCRIPLILVPNRGINEESRTMERVCVKGVSIIKWIQNVFEGLHHSVFESVNSKRKREF